MDSPAFLVTDSLAFTSGKSTNLFWITTPSLQCLHFHTSHLSHLSHSSHQSHQSHNCPYIPSPLSLPIPPTNPSSLPIRLALPFLPQSPVQLALLRINPPININNFPRDIRSFFRNEERHKVSNLFSLTKPTYGYQLYQILFFK